MSLFFEQIPVCWSDHCVNKNINIIRLGPLHIFTWIIPKDRISLREFLRRCTTLSQKAGSTFSRKSPQQTPKPTLLLLSMKYGTKMNYTQHLLIWHAKYTCLMQRYRSFCGGTPVPQCDKAVTPHLCAPTESFCLNVLLMHLIFHVTQHLTSHCRLRRQGAS